jgi:AAA15 family ATPase/GTPase
MLINFTLQNFKSFKEATTFSMVAYRSGLHKDRLSCNRKYKIKLLPFSIIYGGNSSGKTNFFEAIKFVKDITTQRDGWHFNDVPKSIDPSFFALVFLIDNCIYEYSLKFSFQNQTVLKEKLIQIKSTNETVIFRNVEGDLILKRKDVDCLHVKRVRKWMDNLSCLKVHDYDHVCVSDLELINRFINHLDLDIDRLECVNTDFGKEIVTIHKIGGVEHAFSLDEEPKSVRHLCFLIPHLFKSINEKNSGVCIIDPFPFFHPRLTEGVIDAYFSSCDSESKTQLIITSHDTSLLNDKFLRLDEIWTVERNRNNSSKMESFVDYKIDARNDKFLQRSYLQGRLGGVPLISMNAYL